MWLSEVAELFGIVLPENFKRPFFSKSISGFSDTVHHYMYMVQRLYFLPDFYVKAYETSYIKGKEENR